MITDRERSPEEIDWLAERMGFFTASEIHKIMPSPSGRNYKKDLRDIDGAMTYIKTKLAERLTLEYKESIDFKQGEWGKLWEPKAVNEFEKATGVKGVHYGCNNYKFFKYGESAGLSPDWEIENEEGADIKCPYNTSEHITNLLIKSAQEFASERWEYYCQGQFSIKARNWKKFSAVSFDPRMIESQLRLKILPIYPDEKWQTDFDKRLKEAIEMLEELRDELSPSVFIASHEPTTNAMIIEKA